MQTIVRIILNSLFIYLSSAICYDITRTDWKHTVIWSSTWNILSAKFLMERLTQCCFDANGSNFQQTSHYSNMVHKKQNKSFENIVAISSLLLETKFGLSLAWDTWYFWLSVYCDCNPTFLCDCFCIPGLDFYEIF